MVVSSQQGKALLNEAYEVCQKQNRSLFSAPDGIRRFDAHDGAAYILDETIQDRYGKRMLFAFIDWSDWRDSSTYIPMKGALDEAPGYPRGFLTDDTFAFEEFTYGYDDARNKWFLFHRRHPEWWWGHFYRPEVWALTALTIAINWRFIKAIRARRIAPTSASPTAYPQNP